MEHMIHEIKPVFNDKSRILILGSFPSVKSREGQFFYHHPQNRFWKVLAASLSQSVPATVEEKTIFLLSNHIAVWDVIASCDIQGSSDSSIRNVTPNDLTNLLSLAPIRSILHQRGNFPQIIL
ncbi:mismatch-specific DNA glycosylase [Anaerostipes caccae]|nr:DNA-deoxyinosine glycosylase [Anaerostipes caccae]EFV23930.1 mismatch-specific DNA glycosylase [Anaerostipes caccae]